MSRAPAKKKAAPRKKPATRTPAKKTATPQTSMADLVAADIKRAGFRMAVLFYGLGSIFVSSMLGAALVWFTLTTYHERDARVARLASQIIKMETDLSPRMRRAERDLEIIDAKTRDIWTRRDMAAMCLQIAADNENFRCPSPYRISPKRQDKLQPPAKQNEEKSS